MPPDIRLQRLLPDTESHVEDAYRVASRCEVESVGWTDATLESVRASLTGLDAWPDQHLVATLGGEPIGVLVVERDEVGREVLLDA